MIEVRKNLFQNAPRDLYEELSATRTSFIKVNVNNRGSILLAPLWLPVTRLTLGRIHAIKSPLKVRTLSLLKLYLNERKQSTGEVIKNC